MTDATALVRADILSGEFLPGTRLVELQLAGRYGVGRATIRSALVELGSEGLVILRTNRGATVRLVPIEVAIEIAQARAVLEGLAARHAAERASIGERSELQEIIEHMRHAVEVDDRAEYSALNRVLHRRIGEISRHSISNELVANLRNRGTHPEFRLSQVPGRSGVSLPQHAAIVDAIVEANGAQAEIAMHDHLASVQDALRAWTD